MVRSGHSWRRTELFTPSRERRVHHPVPDPLGVVTGGVPGGSVVVHDVRI